MRYELGFGDSPQTIEVEDSRVTDILLPNHVEAAASGEEVVEKALDAPIGSRKLEELAEGRHRVVIITSDITRPMPSRQVIPGVLRRLYQAGVKREEITIVFALGSHRCHREEEKIKLVGEEIYREIRCLDSGESEFVHMGETSHGTPVDIMREVAEADLRICLGNIEFHYFAGFSGGAKAIMPGVSTFEAIQANHRFMVREEAAAGRLEGNPVREDIEEAAGICRGDFLVNVILDEHKRIVKAVAGDMVKAHREGCRFLEKMYRRPIKERADIVVVSQGGAPKDLNLYQTQKALDNAKYAVKDGGIIILAGSCREGMGQPVFESWMREAKTPRDLVERIQKDFRLGGHKAAAIALILERAEIYLVSEMDPELVTDIFMKPYSTVQQALDDALAKQGPDAKVILMPYGGSTLPMPEQQETER